MSNHGTILRQQIKRSLDRLEKTGQVGRPPAPKIHDAVQIDKLINEICRIKAITRAQYMSKRRTAPITEARQIVMALLYWHTDVGLSEIGRMHGGRNHGTVSHAKDQMILRYHDDAETRECFKKLEAKYFGIKNHDAVDRLRIDKRQNRSLPPSIHRIREKKHRTRRAEN